MEKARPARVDVDVGSISAFIARTGASGSGARSKAEMLALNRDGVDPHVTIRFHAVDDMSHDHGGR